MQRQKLCGILAETGMGAGSRIDWLVIGIGINCNQMEADFPPELREMATSLRRCGYPIERTALAAELIRQLTALQADLADPSRYLPRYAASCITLHQDVQLLQGGTATPAYALGIAPDGGLMVQLRDGTKQVVGSGEVSVRGLYGYVK